MKIKIGNSNYIITSDTRQYMLGVDTGRKDADGRPVIDYIGFYHKIDNLLNALMIREPKMSKAQDFEKYIKDVRKAERDIAKLTNCLAQIIGKESEFKKKLESA